MKVSLKSFYEAIADIEDNDGEIPNDMRLWVDCETGNVYSMPYSQSNAHLGDVKLGENSDYEAEYGEGYYPCPESTLDWVA